MSQVDKVKSNAIAYTPPVFHLSNTLALHSDLFLPENHKIWYFAVFFHEVS